MSTPFPPAPELPPGQAGQLLDQLLEPLLHDFGESFERGLELLERCPDSIMTPEARDDLRQRLTTARAELAAARALRAAAPTPMALAMGTITSWHALVVEVWSLSATLRRAG